MSGTLESQNERMGGLGDRKLYGLGCMLFLWRRVCCLLVESIRWLESICVSIVAIFYNHNTVVSYQVVVNCLNDRTHRIWSN